MAVLQKVSAPNAWVPLLQCPKLQCPYVCAPNAVPLVPASLYFDTAMADSVITWALRQNDIGNQNRISKWYYGCCVNYGPHFSP